MRSKKKISIGLFFLLGLSTLMFGSFLLYQTFQVDQWDGRSVVLGVVLDSEGQPLEDVIVISGSRETNTTTNGSWELNGVKEGIIKIEFYKPGYVISTLKWLVYPMEQLGDDIEKSANNISNSYKIELMKEIEEISLDKPINGTLILDLDNYDPIFINRSNIFVGNNISNLEKQTLSGTYYELLVEGNGTFIISFSMGGPYLRGYHPVNSSIDITDGIRELIDTGKDTKWRSFNGMISLSIIWNDEIPSVYTYEIIERRTNESILQEQITDTEKDLEIAINAGCYKIDITGREIRDKTLKWIIVNENGTANVSVTIEKGDVDESLEDHTVKGNYTLSISYLLMAIILFFGGFYMKKNGSWGVLLILAFIGFLSRGFIPIMGININTILSLILVILLFYIRAEYNKNRQTMQTSRRP